LTHIQHLQALTKEIAEETDVAAKTVQGRALIKKLQINIKNILNPSTSNEKEQRVRRDEEQRVIEDTPIIPIPPITGVPPSMQACNPTANRALKSTPRIHARATRNNTPGKLPAINRVHPIPNTDTPSELPNKRVSLRKGAGNPTPPTTIQSLPTRARHRLVTQQAINALTIQEQVEINTAFIPNALRKHHVQQVAPNLKHYANPMVHPITGKTISSYKKKRRSGRNSAVWPRETTKRVRKGQMQCSS
jgi:hypothetical protein